MLKHYFDKHGGEKLEEMKFGGRIIDKPRSAFNKQVSESVIIQHQKQKNHILNSKSEYNRCELPRLTANLGEIPVERMEKDLNEKKKKEKEEERELQRKIRELKVRRGMARRETARENEQPANKRRKLGMETYKRVINAERVGEKRNTEEELDIDQEDKNTAKRKKKTGEEKLPEGLEFESGRKKTDDELAEEWNIRIKEREENPLREEAERTERIEKAKRMQKGWELMRLCKQTIEENGEKWKKSKERRALERSEEEERKERKDKAAEKRRKTLDTI